MEFRHELKHEINYSDMITIRQRLKTVAKPDKYAVNGQYLIRSLYFDNIEDEALLEKLNGINFREKFRIRCYNHDASLIHLEKKSKINNLCNKENAIISAEETQSIINGNTDWMISSDRPLVQELYSKMKSKGLKPRTIVDYTREPFVFAPGNVRVTIDYNIRTGILCTDFLNPECVTIPACESVILEIKWDQFLPSVIRDAVQLDNRRTAAFSKYAACRIYG